MGLFRRSDGGHNAVAPNTPNPAQYAGQPGFENQGAAVQAAQGNPAGRRRFSWKVRATGYLTAIGGLGVGIWLAGMLVYYTVVFPNPLAVRANERAPVIRIVARDGTQLGERGAAHDYMPINLIPKHVIDAVVATEDRRFFDHWGIDPAGLLRASFANLRAGRFVQGGSTLTQQLAKNLFLSSDRTLSRKLDELALAIWLEVRLSKSEILELYLNRVYFGGGAYGVEAAAQRYFDKSARSLTVAEAALIAGLLKAPSKYSPTSNPEAAITRGRSVLAKMRAAGVIDPATYERASAQRVSFADFKGERTANGFEYAIDMALEKLPPLLGEDHGEIIVETTIDAALQKRANAIVRAALDAKGATVKASQAALVTTDPDGGIRALIGGRSFAESQFNRATKARRQPGSVFKPFVYLTAIEQGMTPDTITYDLPITIDGWSPRNDNNRHAGALTLRQALAQSVNTVAVRLAGNAGLPAVSATARRLGIQSDLREDLSMALGTSELSLLELVSAYTVFSNGGDLVEPHIIRRVRLSNGRVLYARQAPLVQRVVSLQHVGAINDMLHSALTAGTGRRAALLHQPAAGKTGTTQDYRDAWFIGYTSHMTTGVWIGNDDGTPMRRVMGGTLPAEIWHDVMAEAHRDLRPMALPGMISLDAVAMAGQDSSARGSDVVGKRYWQISAPATTSSTRGAASGTGRARTAEKSPSIAPSAAPIPMRASKLARAANGKPLPRRAVIGQRLVIEPPKVPSGVATAGPQNTSSSGVPAPAKSTAGQHPSERISADFLARVLTEPSAQEKTETAASQSGFDADAILRQLEAIPDSGRPASRAGLMALGAGASR